MDQTAETPETGFAQIVAIHQALETLFGHHQEALLLLQSERAHRLFDCYRSLLDRHIRHEEELLVPVFQRIGEIQRWPAVLFTGEHRKLEGFLARIEAQLSELGELNPSKAGAIIELIDIEGGLKRLMEHHDAREQECFFPTLDKVTTPEERTQLLAQIQVEWWALHRELLAD